MCSACAPCYALMTAHAEPTLWLTPHLSFAAGLMALTPSVRLDARLRSGHGLNSTPAVMPWTSLFPQQCMSDYQRPSLCYPLQVWQPQQTCAAGSRRLS